MTNYLNTTAIAQHLHKSQHQLGTGAAAKLNEIVFNLMNYFVAHPDALIVELSSDALPVHHTVIDKYLRDHDMLAPRRRRLITLLGQLLTQLLCTAQRFSQRGVLLPSDIESAYSCLKGLVEGVSVPAVALAPRKKKPVGTVNQMQINSSQ